MKVSIVTDTGNIRSRNEDSYLVDTARGLFAVCDGMGGIAAAMWPLVWRCEPFMPG